MTLQEYFEENYERKPFPIIDHSLRVAPRVDSEGRRFFEFYIHPSNTDGITPDFEVKGNEVAEKLAVTQINSKLVPGEAGMQVTCPACPLGVRDLYATAHNLLSSWDGQNWDRVRRKIESLRESLSHMEAIIKKHFEEGHLPL